ncbi:PREDICTED: uncharacterized protein LOC106100346 [Papilio polytes]|uniref:uncharacterized protein LOC106100346 n=1 Tax=Papilio polytes TaxID=76194 RepID=UPI0006761678|nr:PREDICTED: uncharacterized protein LOC106100346 [Papilio polytes]
MYKKKTLFALSMVVCQWTFVSTNSVFTFGTEAPPEEVGRKDHRNTLLDFLDPRGILISPGDAKLRSKRRDITYFTPISSVKHTDALRLLFKTYLAMLLATLRQGKPPLSPPFPKVIAKTIKAVLLN